MHCSKEVFKRFSIPVPHEILNQLRVFSNNCKDIEEILISSIEDCISFECLDTFDENSLQTDNLDTEHSLQSDNLDIEHSLQSDNLDSDKSYGIENSESLNVNLKEDTPTESMKTLDNYFISNKKKVNSKTEQSLKKVIQSSNEQSLEPSKQQSHLAPSNPGTQMKDIDSDSNDIIPSSQDPIEESLPLSASYERKGRSSQDNFSTLSSFSKTVNSDSDSDSDSDLNSTQNSVLTKPGLDLNKSKNIVPNELDSSDFSDSDIDLNKSMAKDVPVKKLSLKLKKSSTSTSNKETSNSSSSEAGRVCPKSKEKEDAMHISSQTQRKSILSFNPNNFDPELGIVSSDSNRNNISCTYSTNIGVKTTNKTPSEEVSPSDSSDLTDSSDNEVEGREESQENDANESGVFLPRAVSSFIQERRGSNQLHKVPLEQTSIPPQILEKAVVPPRVSLLRKEIPSTQIRHSTPLNSPSGAARLNNNHNLSETEESEDEPNTPMVTERQTSDKDSCSSEFQIDSVHDEKWLKNMTSNKIKYSFEVGQETLYLEDLSSDDEVYIVQCPNEVEIKSMYKSEISLCGTSELNLKSTGGDNLICETNCIKQPASRVSLLLPSCGNPLWKIRSVGVCGSVLITEKCQLPMTPSETSSLVCDDRDFDSDDESVQTPLPKDIRIRHPIHGTDFQNTPSPKVSLKKKKYKIQSQETSVDYFSPPTESPEFKIPSNKKKNKKKEQMIETVPYVEESNKRGVTISDSTISLLTDDEGKSRKKKKKTIETLVDVTTLIASPESTPRKEKKKKKRDQQPIETLEEETTLIISPASTPRKEKKKKIRDQQLIDLNSTLAEHGFRGVAVNEDGVSVKKEPPWDKDELLHKKKKKHKTEEDEVSVKEEPPWDKDELLQKKKKKHKTKEDEVSVKEEPPWDKDELLLKKKKKHKTKETLVTDLSTPVELPEFKIPLEKKKKKKNKDQFIDGNTCALELSSRGVAIDDKTVSLVSDDERSMKKKKFKTRDIQVISEVEVAVKEEPVWDRVHISPKKKKKHKTKGIETIETDNDELTSAISEPAPKTKKRKHKDNDVDSSFENIEVVHAKKKKKHKGGVV